LEIFIFLLNETQMIASRDIQIWGCYIRAVKTGHPTQPGSARDGLAT